jgi:hypothetical protein
VFEIFIYDKLKVLLLFNPTRGARKYPSLFLRTMSGEIS